jgi:hypothetical protein
MSDERIESRADLTAEEKVAGSDDPEAQAREILDESDERSLDRDAAPESRVEHRTSNETVAPD